MVEGYAKYQLNMNMRTPVLNGRSFAIVMDELETLATLPLDYRKYKRELLEAQYNLYLSKKDIPKAEQQGTRNIPIAGILGDQYGQLASNGCIHNEYKYTYTINLETDLAFVLAVAFDMNIEATKKKLDTILVSKEISKELISMLMLTNYPGVATPESDSLLDDLCAFKPVEQWLLKLIKDSVYSDIPILNNIGNTYLDYVNVETDSVPTQLSIALKLYLLNTVSEIMQSFVVQFYRKGIVGIIISQDFAAISFSTNSEEVPDFNYYIGLDTYTFKPVRVR